MSQGFQIDVIRSARLNKNLNLDKINANWQKEEVFYRRHENEFSFRYIPKQEFIDGLSVNRSFIARPEDVLFESKFCEIKRDCLFLQKDPKFKFIAFKISSFLATEFLANTSSIFEIVVEIKQDVEDCNCSHCLIRFCNLSSKISDPIPFASKKEFMKKLREHLDANILTL